MKNKKQFGMKRLLSHRVAVAFVAVVTVGGSIVAPMVARADQYDNQINQLKQQNGSLQNSLNGLVADAKNYQDAINKLHSQIQTLQASINANLSEQAKLKQQIVETQKQITADKASLATDIRSMYVDGTPSTIEMLATSKNLSDFVDKQEYRNVVQQNLVSTMKKIAVLQKQLQDKEKGIEILLKSLSSQRDQLASAEAQQSKLLAYNQQQQSSYNNQLAANNAKIDQLREEQRAAYASLTGSGGTSPVGSPIKYKNMTGPQSCGGGYRYCWTTYLDQYVDDPWGFHYARECVHYVLSSLANEGDYIPSFPAGGGNAYNWVPYTTSIGAATLVSNPQPGDVVYLPIAPLGHVAMVDWVNSDGTVHVSQYNWYPGQYNTMDLYITSGIQFLRFHHL